MDELERLIRDANPIAIRRGDPVSARGERDLATIVGTPRVPGGRRGPRRLSIAAGTIGTAWR